MARPDRERAILRAGRRYFGLGDVLEGSRLCNVRGRALGFEKRTLQPEGQLEIRSRPEPAQSQQQRAQAGAWAVARVPGSTQKWPGTSWRVAPANHHAPCSPHRRTNRGPCLAMIQSELAASRRVRTSERSASVHYRSHSRYASESSSELHTCGGTNERGGPSSQLRTAS